VWLSSDRRLVSDIPPVLTPAERAAENGHGVHPAGSLGGGSLGSGPLGGEQF
jgi:cell division protease FtsH